MRVLIVDDEHAARVFLRGVLQAYGSCEEAGDGKEAVRLFRESHERGQPFDLVLMDIMMPNQDGQEALEAIRHVERTHNVTDREKMVKVIMVTALTDSGSVLRAYQDGGATAYLPKPVNVNNLVDLLQDLDFID